MRSDSKGIQHLLVAEKRADDKIGQARKRKAARLKQAKDEALAEIEVFRGEKESQYKEFQDQFLGSRENTAVEIKAKTEEKLKDIDERVLTEKSSVIEFLLHQVLSVESRLHENLLLRRSK